MSASRTRRIRPGHEQAAWEPSRARREHRSQEETDLRSRAAWSALGRLVPSRLDEHFGRRFPLRCCRECCIDLFVYHEQQFSLDRRSSARPAGN